MLAEVVGGNLDTRYITSREGYRREDVPDDMKPFFDGVDYAIEALESLKGNLDVYSSETGIDQLDLMLKNHAEQVIDWCLDWIEISGLEMQISVCEKA